MKKQLTRARPLHDIFVFFFLPCVVSMYKRNVSLRKRTLFISLAHITMYITLLRFYILQKTLVPCSQGKVRHKSQNIVNYRQLQFKQNHAKFKILISQKSNCFSKSFLITRYSDCMQSFKGGQQNSKLALTSSSLSSFIGHLHNIKPHNKDFRQLDNSITA